MKALFLRVDMDKGTDDSLAPILRALNEIAYLERKLDELSLAELAIYKPMIEKLKW